MIRMLIVGYCYGIRSERRLCEEAHLNLAYRWFCRLSLEDEVPNHSTFSKNRHGRFRDSDVFRWLFNEVLRRCMDAGLVKGEGFAVDASIIKADASRQRGVPGDEPVHWSDPALSTRAVREYLEALDEEALAETLPKRLSLTDPQARGTAAPGGPAFFAYSTNYLIDTEHGVIMDVEPTPAHRTAEVESTKTMIERVEAQFDIKPERLIGDTHERKKVEMLFAHLKRILKLDRLRLRAMSGATDEFTLPLRCRTCDGWPNFHLKGHQSRDRCACTKQKTSN